MKQIKEPEFIGGEGALTKKEEIALSKYFAKMKNKESKPSDKKLDKKNLLEKVILG